MAWFKAPAEFVEMVEVSPKLIAGLAGMADEDKVALVMPLVGEQTVMTLDAFHEKYSIPVKNAPRLPDTKAKPERPKRDRKKKSLVFGGATITSIPAAKHDPTLEPAENVNHQEEASQ
jgi:hypothetical protein